MMAVAAALAIVGAFGIGFTIGSRRERVVAQGDIANWRTLANELHAENGKLRCEGTPVPSAGVPPSGAPNQLHRLRQRLEVSAPDVAGLLGISVADLDALEHTRLELLELGDVECHANALGCRLDVVAVHRLDGIAHWLSDDHVRDRLKGGGS